MLSQTGGHADFHIPAGISATEIIGGVLVDSVEQARLEAQADPRGRRRHQDRFVGWREFPNDQPTFLGFRTEMVAAVVEEGQNYGGRPVAAHAIGRPVSRRRFRAACTASSTVTR